MRILSKLIFICNTIQRPLSLWAQTLNRSCYVLLFHIILLGGQNGGWNTNQSHEIVAVFGIKTCCMKLADKILVRKKIILTYSNYIRALKSHSNWIWFNFVSHCCNWNGLFSSEISIETVQISMHFYYSFWPDELTNLHLSFTYFTDRWCGLPL